MYVWYFTQSERICASVKTLSERGVREKKKKGETDSAILPPPTRPAAKRRTGEFV